jgi:uncharacterized membrane protein YvbJ
MSVICTSCKKEFDESSNFCPHCGKKSEAADVALTSAQRIKIYLASFFLSPFGLIWFFKYFRDEKKENKTVAYTSLVITLIPLILLFFVGRAYISSFSSVIDMYKSNLNVYSELGL